MKKSYLILLFATCALTAKAQADDVPTWTLPPLEALIDSALNNAVAIEAADVAIKISEHTVIDAKRNWIKNINMSADARYGSMLDYSRLLNVSGGQFIPFSANQYSWSVGGGLSLYLPLTEIVDRGRNIRKAKLSVTAAEIEKRNKAEAVEQQVISSYYDLQTAQRMLEIQTEMLTLAQANYDQAKSEYTQNRLGLKEYTTIFETYLKARSEQETRKLAFLKAIKLMELLTGVTLLKN